MTKTIPPKQELERKYLIEKKSATRIGEEYGVSNHTAKHWLMSHDIPIRHRSIVRPPKGELVKMYELCTVGEIAVKYNCCSQTVIKWFGEYGIQTKRSTSKNTTCRILKDHAKDLKHDPERLSTEFLQKMIGVKCD